MPNGKRPDVRSVPITRSFSWIRGALETFRERPLPGSYLPVIAPTFDVFGSEQIENVRTFSVVGGGGQIEVVDGPVPEGRWRFVQSMACLHTDGVSQIMAPIRVVPEAGFFVQQEFVTDVFLAPFVTLAVRNFAVGPGAFYGYRVLALGVLAQIGINGLFIEMDVGEYPNLGSVGS